LEKAIEAHLVRGGLVTRGGKEYIGLGLLVEEMEGRNRNDWGWGNVSREGEGKKTARCANPKKTKRATN